VIYLYLDRLSNAFSGWGRSGGDTGHDHSEREQGSIKEAAE
jgi:HAE1 family hydrophobic/amphiphilic exporter-1